MNNEVKRKIVEGLDPSKTYYCKYGPLGILYNIDRNGIHGVPGYGMDVPTRTINTRDIDYDYIKGIVYQVDLFENAGDIHWGNLELAGFTDNEIEEIYQLSKNQISIPNMNTIDGCWVLKGQDGKTCWGYIDGKKHVLQQMTLNGDDIVYNNTLSYTKDNATVNIVYDPKTGLSEFKENLGSLGLKLLYRITTSDIETIKQQIKNL